MADLETMRVALRVRPLSEIEKSNGSVCMVKVVTSTDGDEVKIGDGKATSERFTYNHAFGPNTAQQQLYDGTVVQLIDKLFKGFNVTVLAYGQTSSGKTYTMGTDFTGALGENVGVIPRVVSDIFRMVEERRANNKNVPPPKVTCSYIELYQENVFDLLSRNRKSIDIHELDGVCILPGLINMPVTSVEATLNCLVRGSAGRCVGSTALNNTSSRSHAIFTINITQHSPDDPSSLIESNFHLVDLAGSERQKKSKTTGQQFKEGVKINQGLLALGNVISTLSSFAYARNSGGGSGSKSVHVPYRDSKLTRLLQHSLGGNSYTLMIACVSPANDHLIETLSTLRYANRVCKIKNKPIINVDPQRVQIDLLEKKIKDLHLELSSLKKDTGVPQIGPTPSNISATVRLQQVEQKNDYLYTKLQSMVQSMATNEIRTLAAEKLLENIEAAVKATSAASANNEDDDNEQMADEGDANRNGEKGDTCLNLISNMLRAYKEERIALEALSGINADTDVPESTLDSTNVTISNRPRSEDIQRASDYHTKQQIRMQNELSQLNQELAAKEILHQRCLDVSEAGSSINTPSIEKLLAMVEKSRATIEELQAQILQQNELLENSKEYEKKSKLAEKRRCKVRDLEAQLSALQVEHKKLETQLMTKENNACRVKTLTTEINAMKAMRVTLLKTIQMEHAKFKQWKNTHEKEICHLKKICDNRDIKMSQMESKHVKEQQAMERKMKAEKRSLVNKMNAEKKLLQQRICQAEAVNRRLLAACDVRQGPSGQTRTDHSVLQGTEAMRWIERELEIIHSAVEATEELKLLSKQRDVRVKTLAQLKVTAKKEIPVVKAELEVEIACCENFVGLCNTQIANLEKKLFLTNIEKLIVAFSENLAALPQSRQAFRQLLDTIVQKNAQLVLTRYQVAELQATNNLYEEELNNAWNTDDNPDAQGDSEGEVKVSKASKSKSNDAGGPSCKKPKKSHPLIYMEEESEDEFDKLVEDESMEDFQRDPTFRGTPFNKRNKLKPAGDVSMSDPPSGSAFCSCTGFCSTMRCKCKKIATTCVESCKCTAECVNRDETTGSPLSPARRVQKDESGSGKDRGSKKNKPLKDEEDTSACVQRKAKRKPFYI